MTYVITSAGAAGLLLGVLIAAARGRVDDLPFFEYLSPFCFLSIEFHCTISISFIKY